MLNVCVPLYAAAARDGFVGALIMLTRVVCEYVLSSMFTQECFVVLAGCLSETLSSGDMLLVAYASACGPPLGDPVVVRERHCG